MAATNNVSPSKMCRTSVDYLGATVRVNYTHEEIKCGESLLSLDTESFVFCQET
jgi:hypothetical protein